MLNSVSIHTPLPHPQSGLKERTVLFSRSYDRLAVIAGPCVVESKEVLVTVAEQLIKITERLPIDFVFKSSYRKANRTSADSFTGIGDDRALVLLEEIKTGYGLPILTDIHSSEEASMAAEVCDILQIPAFLARQTELLAAAAQTGKVVNVKKGQFMAAEDMKHAMNKVFASGNYQVLLTERGTFFGYGDLVVDFRSLEIMSSFGVPVIFDATHSVQRPSQNGVSGGERRFIPTLAKAAVAVGIDGLFIETHPNPAAALSDKSTQLPLNELEPLLEDLLELREASRRITERTSA